MSTRIKIVRCTDAKLVAAFKKLKEQFPIAGVASGNLAGGVSLGEWDLPAAVVPPLWAKVLKEKGSALKYALLPIGGLHVNFYRGGMDQERLDPYFDIIDLVWHGGPLSDEDRVAIALQVNREFESVVPGRAADIGGLGGLAELHNSTLEKLETTTATVLAQNTELAADLQKQLKEAREHDSEMLADRQKTLEEHFADKEKMLKDREADVVRRLGEIDARDNTTARRGIRDKMLEDVKARIEHFGVTADTQAKRRPVRQGIVVLISVVLSLLMLSTLELHMEAQSRNEIRAQVSSRVGVQATESSIAQAQERAKVALETYKSTVDPVEKYWLWSRIGLLTLAAIATLLYYIRWENRWAERHIDSELQLQQFDLDVNRANWVLESCLEWRQATNSAIPAELLSSMTRNLFTERHQDVEQVIHPADELASAILGSASKVTLNTGAGSVEIDKPARKIPKSKVLSQPKPATATV